MWPFRRRRRQEVDPGRPHAFLRHDDPSLGVLASSTRAGPPGLGLTQFPPDDDLCAVPGCGRGRDDELHAEAR